MIFRFLLHHGCFQPSACRRGNLNVC